MRHLWKAGIALAAAVLVAACGPVLVQSNPDTFALPVDAGNGIRGSQTVAVSNGYPSTRMETIMPAGVTWIGDMKAYTDSAITMLNREMGKNRVSISPGAQKTITLRVRSLQANPGGFVIRSSVVMDAAYGDGTSSTVQAQNASPSDAHRAVSGALMHAVTQLLRDQNFLAYVNK